MLLKKIFCLSILFLSSNALASKWYDLMEAGDEQEAIAYIKTKREERIPEQVQFDNLIKKINDISPKIRISGYLQKKGPDKYRIIKTHETELRNFRSALSGIKDFYTYSSDITEQDLQNKFSAQKILKKLSTKNEKLSSDDVIKVSDYVNLLIEKLNTCKNLIKSFECLSNKHVVTTRKSPSSPEEMILFEEYFDTKTTKLDALIEYAHKNIRKNSIYSKLFTDLINEVHNNSIGFNTEIEKKIENSKSQSLIVIHDQEFSEVRGKYIGNSISASDAHGDIVLSRIHNKISSDYPKGYYPFNVVPATDFSIGSGLFCNGFSELAFSLNTENKKLLILNTSWGMSGLIDDIYEDKNSFFYRGEDSILEIDKSEITFTKNEELNEEKRKLVIRHAEDLKKRMLLELKKISSQIDTLWIKAAGNEESFLQGNKYCRGFDPTCTVSEILNQTLYAGAWDPFNQRMPSYSNKAGELSDHYILAPADFFLHPLTNGKFILMKEGGTSSAAPVISAAAAIVAHYYPTLSGQQVKQALLAGAKKDILGYDRITHGAGLLNLPSALSKAKDLADNL